MMQKSSETLRDWEKTCLICGEPWVQDSLDDRTCNHLMKDIVDYLYWQVQNWERKALLRADCCRRNEEKVKELEEENKALRELDEHCHKQLVKLTADYKEQEVLLKEAADLVSKGSTWCWEDARTWLRKYNAMKADRLTREAELLGMYEKERNPND